MYRYLEADKISQRIPRAKGADYTSWKTVGDGTNRLAW